jgi:3-oxoacyl-[acyl-carrier protein] reductase
VTKILTGKIALVTGGPRGITVNNVQPGPVDTDMNPADGPFAESMKGMMALGRYGQGDEIAAMVVYLANPKPASSPAPA